MIDRLPLVRPFLPGRLRWRLADARLNGTADSFGLPADVVTTDGGGWWVADFGLMRASSAAHHRALRAMALRLRGGRRVEVPFLEKASTGGLTSVGFSDGASFSDDTEFQSGAVTAVLDEPLALRADVAVIRITSGHQLLGGDVFSLLRSPTLGSELHATSAVEALSGNRWAVEIGPQFRQAYPAGTEVNFNDPCCAMRLNDPEGRLWPEAAPAWNVDAAARFEEAVR